MAPGDQHAYSGNQVRHGGEKADGEVRQTEGLEHLRHPEADPVEANHQAEIKKAELDHAWIGERLADAGIADGARVFSLGLEPSLKRDPLLRREPVRVLRAVGEESEGHDDE